ncbi:uncharacterized protein C2845_PM06G33080 [Panicum miliaceum]|uniref:Pectinesterase inhibitor domain-containing protein n=1 Tax=Panicum miliaceum TaxID=4540 RepID=A0A3L6R9H3_PANMI|nr:uncharacterized protein C2845_PM06G33080 [Panicum miliaceum]
MRTSLLGASPILAVALAAAALCCGGAGADTVADSCNAIRDFADVAFCVSRLRSVPGAASADLAAASGAAAGAAARVALRACALLYGAGSVPVLQIMRGYAAARGWEAAHAMFVLARQAGGGAAGRTMAAANRTPP